MVVDGVVILVCDKIYTFNSQFLQIVADVSGKVKEIEWIEW